MWVLSAEFCELKVQNFAAVKLEKFAAENGWFAAVIYVYFVAVPSEFAAVLLVKENEENGVKKIQNGVFKAD